MSGGGLLQDSNARSEMWPSQPKDLWPPANSPSNNHGTGLALCSSGRHPAPCTWFKCVSPSNLELSRIKHDQNTDHVMELPTPTLLHGTYT